MDVKAQRWPAALAVLAGFAAGCAGSAHPGPVPKRPATAPGRAAALPEMTLEQLAGQRVIYSYPGLTPPGSLKKLIAAGKAGGVIFFSGNIGSRSQIAGVIADLQRLSRFSPAHEPLLMLTDQEGGAVRRLPGAPQLSEKQAGQSAYPGMAAASAGRGAGLNLRGVGMNLNLAPVLDVSRAAGSFIGQYGRSYSGSPALVSALGADFIRAQQATGVAATAKHFPGLGAAARGQDTDLRPVTVNLSAAAIRRVDEYPYRAAIRSGVDLVMASWAVYPALAAHPAGLSPAIVQGELRRRLGFAGVTITDALEAGALRGYGPAGHRGVLAAEAGMDLLLCSSRNVSEGAQVLSALTTALRDGRLNRAAFSASVGRVLALRARLAR
jgi:beta-N-acetylhexosaminidase